MKVYIGPHRKNRRVDVRIDKWDTWDMDHTLAHIIVPMLKQLKSTKHGAPFVDNEDVPEELRMSEEELDQFHEDGASDSKFFKRWDWVLDEMIWAFTYKRDNFDSLMDKDSEAVQARMTNGFKLFGKYYENLWD